jgi:GNAT superfamily N-acetyltransferase
MPAIAIDPALLFPNPPLDSLTTVFAHLALRSGRALKFPREVTPFSALLENSTLALTDLHSLLQPGESTFVISFKPLSVIPGLTVTGPHPVRQFDFPAEASLPPAFPGIPIEPLTCAEAAEMVELTSIAFPGFFRIRTCEMGPYFGIRENGRLVAMCGERMNIGDYREISGLCTHPDVRGRGYAPALLGRLLHDHRAAGLRSYLHVASGNTTGIALYNRLGFLACGEFPLYSVRRTV